MRLSLLRPLGASSRAAIVLAAATLGVGCHIDSAPTRDVNALFIFADFENPTVAVAVNGQALGTLSNQYTGARDCAALNSAIGSGAMLGTTIKRGEHYTITWDYGGTLGTQTEEFDATDEAMTIGCILEVIVAP